MLSSIEPVCPPELLHKAADLPSVGTAIVNAGNKLAMESALLATEANLIRPIFVGNRADIASIAKDLNWPIDKFRIVPADTETLAANAAVALARGGEVNALMKGHIHTDTLMRAVVDRTNGIRTRRRPSHVFHMSVPHRHASICITDAVINVLPTVKAKLDIARNAADLLHALGHACPNIAVLSATETPNASMPSSVSAQEVAERATAGAVTGANVAGPLSFDMAVSAAAAKVKGFTGPMSGNADVLLVPNIEAGNFLFKQMVYYMGATAAGIVLGARVPIMLTSRADPPVARVAAAALAAIFSSSDKSRTKTQSSNN
jgi:phosphotransacetylase